MVETTTPETEQPKLTANQFAELSAEVAVIERQLSRIKDKLAAAQPRMYKTFGELRGVLADTPDIPYEVFQEAKYHFMWEGEDSRDMH